MTYVGNSVLKMLEGLHKASEPETCFQTYHYSSGPESQEGTGANLIRKPWETSANDHCSGCIRERPLGVQNLVSATASLCSPHLKEE